MNQQARPYPIKDQQGNIEEWGVVVTAGSDASLGDTVYSQPKDTNKPAIPKVLAKLEHTFADGNQIWRVEQKDGGGGGSSTGVSRAPVAAPAPSSSPTLSDLFDVQVIAFKAFKGEGVTDERAIAALANTLAIQHSRGAVNDLSPAPAEDPIPF